MGHAKEQMMQDREDRFLQDQCKLADHEDYEYGHCERCYSSFVVVYTPGPSNGEDVGCPGCGHYVDVSPGSHYRVFSTDDND